MVETFVFPDDRDVENICREAGVDQEFDDADIIRLIYKYVQISSFSSTDNIQVAMSPFGERTNAYYVSKTGSETDKDTDCCWDNPNAHKLKEESRKLAKSKAAKEAQLRFTLSTDMSTRKIEEERVARRNAQVRELKKEALLFYNARYGSPDVDDVGQTENGLGFWLVSPKMVIAVASREFSIDLASEPELAWVIRQYIASELPPRWTIEMDNDGKHESLLHRRLEFFQALDIQLALLAEEPLEDSCSKNLNFKVAGSSETNGDSKNPVFLDEHPGKEYFDRLVESVREETELLWDDDANSQLLENSTADDDFRKGILRFFDLKTEIYYEFDFKSNEGRVLQNGLPAPPCLEQLWSGDCSMGDEASIAGKSNTDGTTVPQKDTRIYTAEEVESFLKRAQKKDMWVLLTNLVSQDEIDTFLAFCGVERKGEETEFLQDIFSALVSPLPSGWVKRLDPDGLPHFTCLAGEPVPRLAMTLESGKKNKSKRSLPQWAYRAAAMGLPVQLHFFSCSKFHPRAEDCKILFEKERQKREKRELQARIKKRQDESEKANIARSAAKRQHSLHVYNEVTDDPLVESFRYYCDRYGEPSDLSAIKIPQATDIRTPDMVFKMAKHLFIDKTEFHLLWIPHMRLAVEAPPAWTVGERTDRRALTGASYIHNPTGHRLDYHPADAYFLALATSAREQCFCDKDRNILDMIDSTGLSFRYDASSNEITSDSDNGRSSPTRSSGVFLSSSRIAIPPESRSPSKIKLSEGSSYPESPRYEKPEKRASIGKVDAIDSRKLQGSLSIFSPKQNLRSIEVEKEVHNGEGKMAHPVRSPDQDEEYREIWSTLLKPKRKRVSDSQEVEHSSGPTFSLEKHLGELIASPLFHPGCAFPTSTLLDIDPMELDEGFEDDGTSNKILSQVETSLQLPHLHCKEPLVASVGVDSANLSGKAFAKLIGEVTDAETTQERKLSSLKAKVGKKGQRKSSLFSDHPFFATAEPCTSKSIHHSRKATHGRTKNSLCSSEQRLPPLGICPSSVQKIVLRPEELSMSKIIPNVSPTVKTQMSSLQVLINESAASERRRVSKYKSKTLTQ